MLAVCYCGLFSTGTPEDPVGEKEPDPLQFKKVLRGTIEQFVFDDYNDLFNEQFIYIDPSLLQYSRQRLLTRLANIEALYTGEFAQQKLENVIWFKADTNSSDPEFFDKEKEITLQPRGYYVILIHDTVRDTAKGEATFKLRYDKSREEWEISSWRDVPSDGAEKSFFHPDFSH